MAKTKSKKNIVLTKENLLYQPLSLAVSGYNATAFQQNIVIGVLRKLKTALTQAKEGQFHAPPVQLSLFENPETAIYRRTDDEMKIAIHMRELGVEPNNYHRAFEQVRELGRIMAWVPEKQPDGSEHLRMETVFGLELDKQDVITDDKDQVIGMRKNRSPIVYINIKRSVADFVFNPKSRIYDFIDDTAMLIKDKYPKRLYMYLSNHKYMDDGLTIGYWKFRQQIGFDDRNKEKIMYPQFYDFKKKVLDVSAKVLKELADKDMCDFWFEWEPIYKGSRKAKAPDELHFTFHLSNVGKSIKADKAFTPRAKEMEVRLRDEFDQTAAQVKRILYAMKPEDYDAVNEKLDELKRYLEGTNNEIRNKRAYVNKVLTEFLAGDKVEEAVEEVEMMDSVMEPNSAVEVLAKPATVMSEDERVVWDRMMVGVGDDWRGAMECVEMSGDRVVVMMPSVAAKETWEASGGSVEEMERVSERKVEIRVREWFG